MMQPWAVVVLLLPLINGDVSHLPKEYIPPSAEQEPTTRSAADGQEVQKDPSGFYPSTGLPLPPGYAIPTGSNVPPSPVQPPNFPLPIYPPFFGFGGGSVEQGGGPGIGPVPSAYPNGAAFPGGPPNGGAFPGGPPNGGAFPGGPPNGGVFPGGPPNGGAFPGGPTNAAFQLPPGGPFGPQAGNFAQPGGFPQAGGFPPQGAGFQPQGIPGNGFPPQGAPFSPQPGAFPPQGGAFGPQGIPGNGFPGGNFPPQGGPFPGSAYPPEFLTNQGLPLTNPQGPFQGPSPAGFNVPAGFGGPVPGQNPYQQFGPGFGGPAPPGYSDEPAKEQPKDSERTVVPPPLADDPKSAADTVYASNGGYVYKRAK